MPRSEYDELRAGFTAAVSHELRTPLARLLALLESAELPGATSRRSCGRLMSEVEEMTELVDDILFLSELEQDREVVSLGETEAAPVLRELVAALGSAPSSPASRSTCASRTRGCACLCAADAADRGENLLVNVIRYAGEGATCTITLRREGDDAVLEVADDGTGVPDEDVPRLFERFFRSDRARTTRGSGLASRSSST